MTKYYINLKNNRDGYKSSGYCLAHIDKKLRRHWCGLCGCAADSYISVGKTREILRDNTGVK